MKRFALAVIALSALVSAQQTTKIATLPGFIGSGSTNNIPFGERSIRYQQWYSGAELARTTVDPVRIIGLSFPGPLPPGLILDVEVTMANGSSRLVGQFDNNLRKNKTVVIKRKMVALGGTPGVISIPFDQDFIFDGVANVVVELRIYNNGLGKFAHTARSTTLRTSNTFRQYFIGNADASVANSQSATNHYGLVTNFLYQEGGTYEYGAGCVGGRNILPVGTANEIPLPGLPTYTQRLDFAGSGFPCVFYMGVSRTDFNGIPLPLSLGFLGAPSCMMLAAPHLQVFTRTVGGGPGTGKAVVPTPIPGIGALAGFKVYSQWLIFDSGAPNGLSVTRGLMHVIGS